MRNHVRRVEHHQDAVFDNCGTGGDGAGTFNISTTTSFVIAGAGLAVAKHGNRSVSSSCGSADLLEALGANISLTPEMMGTCIDEIGIGFLFAPLLHPAMKNVAPVRKALGIRTIFNLLGPLTNPAFVTHQMIGVCGEEYVEKIALAAREIGIERVFVVYNHRRIDELTTAGINQISAAGNGVADNFELHPTAYGFAECTLEDLQGGTPEENVRITNEILAGEPGPCRDSVILNAAVALFAAEKVGNIEDGIALAAESIDSGQAAAILKRFIEFTNRVRNAG
jgi:anthranilate phosphoribosyltransferase